MRYVEALDAITRINEAQPPDAHAQLVTLFDSVKSSSTDEDQRACAEIAGELTRRGYVPAVEWLMQTASRSYMSRATDILAMVDLTQVPEHLLNNLSTFTARYTYSYIAERSEDGQTDGFSASEMKECRGIQSNAKAALQKRQSVLHKCIYCGGLFAAGHQCPTLRLTSSLPWYRYLWFAVVVSVPVVLFALAFWYMDVYKPNKAKEEMESLAFAAKQYARTFGAYPTGDSSLILAALKGNNPKGRAFIFITTESSSARDAVPDPWGTSYRISIISNRTIRVSCAGPNWKFGDKDDIRIER